MPSETDHLSRVAHDGADVVGVAGTGHEGDFKVFLDEEVTDGVDHALALVAGQVAEGAALPLLIIGNIAEDVVVQGQAPHRLDGITDLVSDCRLLDAVHERTRAAGVHPVGQEGVQDCGGGGVRILIERDVDAGVAALIDQPHHALAHAIDGIVVVRDVDRNTGSPPDINGFAEGVEQAVAQGVSRMGHIHSAQVGDGLANRNQLVGVAVGAGRVGQAGGESEGAVLHGLASQLTHVPKFRFGRQAVLPAHGLDADCSVGSHEGDVAGDAIVEQVEVLSHRAPANASRRHPIDRGQVIQQLFQFLWRGRSVGEAVHSHQLGGYALPQLDLVLWIGEQHQV